MGGSGRSDHPPIPDHAPIPHASVGTTPASLTGSAIPYASLLVRRATVRPALGGPAGACAALCISSSVGVTTTLCHTLHTLEHPHHLIRGAVNFLIMRDGQGIV